MNTIGPVLETDAWMSGERNGGKRGQGERVHVSDRTLKRVEP